VLISPEVLYSGPEAADALVKAGIVARRNDRYFIVDMKKLLLDYVVKGKTWDALGTPTLHGPVLIRSTNPAQSNSGFTAYLLKLIILATNDVYTAPTVDQARAALPTVRAIYDAQGLQARSSGYGFDEWVLQGGEVSAPLYAGYESQVIEKVAQYPQQVAQLLQSIRVLYPEPTVYNEHPILALDARGQRLIEAMKDPQIQAIAWKKYGFRSVLLGVTNVNDFPSIGLADRVQTTSLPSAEVILMLNDCLVKNACR
jgi:hypothetical protein